MTGHLLGASGALEAAVSVMAIAESAIPPTINLEACDEDMQDLTFVTSAHQHATQHVLCNGFGFGGVNAALIVSSMER